MHTNLQFRICFWLVATTWKRGTTKPKHSQNKLRIRQSYIEKIKHEMEEGHFHAFTHNPAIKPITQEIKHYNK